VTCKSKACSFYELLIYAPLIALFQRSIASRNNKVFVIDDCYCPICIGTITCVFYSTPLIELLNFTKRGRWNLCCLYQETASCQLAIGDTGLLNGDLEHRLGRAPSPTKAPLNSVILSGIFVSLPYLCLYLYCYLILRAATCPAQLRLNSTPVLTATKFRVMKLIASSWLDKDTTNEFVTVNNLWSVICIHYKQL
jgi:hypothetical protein